MIPNNMVKTILMWPRFILTPYFRLSLFTPLAIGLVAATAIHAQEIVEVSGQDRYIDPDFEEVYRVGALEGDSWEMFSMVKKVGFDEQGNLYVFDDAGSLLSPDLRILVFDASGAFVHEFGTRGRGTGRIHEAQRVRSCPRRHHDSAGRRSFCLPSLRRIGTI